MEYSVFDLIRILLRKWYVVLISMCVLGGLSVITARTSYGLAVQSYERSVSETVSAGVDTGTLSATYLYGYELSDLTKYLSEARQKAAFYERFAEELGTGGELAVDAAALAEHAYAGVSQEAAALIGDARVLEETQTAMDALHYVEPPVLDGEGKIVESDSPLSVSGHLQVESLPDNVIRITVFGLEEQPARKLLAAYLRVLKSVGRSDYSLKVNMTERENVFTLDPLRLSQSAQFAQVVMAKPEMAPILVKNIGTAAAYAFVLSCFVILAVTFVRDSRRTERAKKEP